MLHSGLPVLGPGAVVSCAFDPPYTSLLLTSMFVSYEVAPKPLKSSLRPCDGSEQQICDAGTTPLSMRPLARASAICPAPMNPIRLSNTILPSCTKYSRLAENVMGRRNLPMFCCVLLCKLSARMPTVPRDFQSINSTSSRFTAQQIGLPRCPGD